MLGFGLRGTDRRRGAWQGGLDRLFRDAGVAHGAKTYRDAAKKRVGAESKPGGEGRRRHGSGGGARGRGVQLRAARTLPLRVPRASRGARRAARRAPAGAL